MSVKIALAVVSLGFIVAGCAEYCGEPKVVVAPVVAHANVTYECEPQCTHIHEHKGKHHVKHHECVEPKKHHPKKHHPKKHRRAKHHECVEPKKHHVAIKHDDKMMDKKDEKAEVKMDEAKK